MIQKEKVAKWKEKLQSKRDYWTFLFSLVLVLLVPLSSFSLLYVNYFGHRYSEKVLSLAEAASRRTQVYFEQTVNQCNRIAKLLESKEIFSVENPGQNPSIWQDLCRELNEVRILNEALVEIVYQQKDSSVLFTTESTIYAPLNAPDVLHRMETLPTSPGFYQKAFIGSGPEAVSSILSYTIPLEDGAILNFWLDAALLLPAPSEDKRFALTLFDNNTPIWQSGGNREITETGSWMNHLQSQENFSLVTTTSGNYYINALRTTGIGATLYFMLPYDMVTSETTAISRTFLLVILLEAVACIGLIVLLARRSYRPVRELYGSVLKFAPELLPSVPAGELDAANYALQSLSKREQDLKREHDEVRLQKSLHRLFTGKLQDPTKLMDAGIDIFGKPCAVCCLRLRKKVADTAFEALEKRFRVLLSEGGFTFYSANYLESRSQLFLLLMPYGRSCAEVLEDVANRLADECGMIFCISCGTVTDQWQEIWRSAYRAIANLEEEHDTILYEWEKSSKSQNFSTHYPQADINGLYNAIVTKNAERTHFLTDTLLRKIEALENSFYATNTSNATIIALLRGAGELQINDADLEQISFRHMGDAPKYIEELSDTVINFINDLCQKEALNTPAQNGFEQILSFIMENINNPNLGVALIGDALGISPAALGKLFHDHMNTTISEYMGTIRHEHIKMLLRSTDQSVSEIAIQMGYSQTSSFIRRFKSMEGITPGEYRQKEARPEDSI